MKRMKIKIIDRIDARRKSICENIQRFYENIRRLGSFQILYAKSIYDNKGQPLDESEEKPDLIFLHISDHEDAEGAPFCGYLKHINEQCPLALIVIYSGGRITYNTECNHIVIMQDERKWDFEAHNANKFCIVKNPIKCAEDLHLNDVLEYCNSGNIDPEKLFEILKKGPPQLDILPALLMLCEIYLSVYAQTHKEKQYHKIDSVRLALEKIKWHVIPLKSNEKNFEEVEKPLWWQNVFGEESQKPNVTHKIEEEWGKIQAVPRELNLLINSIFGRSEERIKPEMVAKAFNTILEKLKR